MALGTNKGRNKDKKRLRDDVTQCQPVNRPIPTYNHRQLVYNDESEEDDDFMFADHRPTRGGSRNIRNFDRDASDFKLKVDILYFNDNLNIEDLIDWHADIDKYFNYMEIPEEKRVRLVACRLKRGASARWERLQTRRICEKRQPVRI